MKIVVLADIHGNIRLLERYKESLWQADVVLLAGDITNFGSAAEAREVLDAIGQYAKRILAVPGNCDPEPVVAYLAEAGVSLHGRAACIDGWAFIGAGGALPMGDLSNKAGQSLFQATLEQGLTQCGGAKNLVVVTHQPARHTALDAVAPGRSVGNQAIRDFIDRVKPKLAVSGHIHEINGTDRLGDTTLVSPGPAQNGHYAEVVLTEDDVAVRIF